MFQTVCPFCSKTNNLSPPIELPTRCSYCYRAFEPTCSGCNKIFHGCQCRDSGVTRRRVTPLRITINPPPEITPTRPPIDDGWRTPPIAYKQKRADTEPIARTRTITTDRPVIKLDEQERESLERLTDAKVHKDPLDSDRDRLLTYLVEAISRIENFIYGAPQDILDEMREHRAKHKS